MLQTRAKRYIYFARPALARQTSDESVYIHAWSESLCLSHIFSSTTYSANRPIARSTVWCFINISSGATVFRDLIMAFSLHCETHDWWVTCSFSWWTEALINTSRPHFVHASTVWNAWHATNLILFRIDINSLIQLLKIRLWPHTNTVKPANTRFVMRFCGADWLYSMFRDSPQPLHLYCETACLLGHSFFESRSEISIMQG